MSTILCFSVNMGCCVYINEEKKWTNDFSKWLQYNKEWKIEGSLNTFRTHCISSQVQRLDLYVILISKKIKTHVKNIIIDLILNTILEMLNLKNTVTNT